VTAAPGCGGDGCAATVAPRRPPHPWAAVIPPHESAVRRLAAEAAGADYRALRSLDEARAAGDGVAVLEGDLGGRIYAVFPSAIVRCSEEGLLELAYDLDAHARSAAAAAGRGDGAAGAGEVAVYFERHRVGAAIAGGSGGGVVLPGGWVHDQFVRAGIESTVLAVVAGHRDRLGSPGG
jgi:hypothetical protein